MARESPAGVTFPRGFRPGSIRWPLVPARDLFELRYGKALVEADRRPGDVPVYGTNGQCGSHDTELFVGPGVILGRKGQGPLGVEWCEVGYWVIDTAYSLVPLRADIDLRFAYFLLKYIGLNHLKDGTSNPSLNREVFGAQALPLPPLPAQHSIARILGALDDKIELNRKMNVTLEQMARAIFKSWFVDFEPFRDKGMVDSPLGKIPKKWEAGALSDLVVLTGGGTPRTTEPSYWGGDIPWYSVEDAPAESDVFVIGTERSITKKGLAESSTRLLPRSTTIISARGTVGSCALTGAEMAMNQSCYGVRGANGRGDLFVYFAVRRAVGELRQVTHGAVFDTITRDTFKAIDASVPPPEVTRQFDTTVSPYLLRILNNLRESRTLAAIRDALLPKLISGELAMKAGL
jgi:type I restriction enzyme S subunit